MRKLIYLLVLPLLVCGCNLLFGDPNASPTATPTNTPSPTPTVEPTATPNIPPVDERLFSMEEVVDLPTADWPARSRMRYRHTNGMVYEAEAALHRGEGFLLYALENTGDASADRFILESLAQGVWRLCVAPTEENPYDSLEGLYIYSPDGNGVAAAARAMDGWKAEGYEVVSTDSIAAWNQRVDPNSMLYGALPYDGEYSKMQYGNHMLHILRIEGQNGILTAALRIEELGSTSQLEYYLYAMLSTLRAIGRG